MAFIFDPCSSGCAVWQSSAELTQLGRLIATAIEKYRLYSAAIDMSNRKLKLLADKSAYVSSSMGAGKYGSSGRWGGAASEPELSVTLKARAETAACDAGKLQALLDDFTSAALQFRDLLRETEVDALVLAEASPSPSTSASIDSHVDDAASVGRGSEVDTGREGTNTISPLVKIETCADGSSRPSIVI
jgi:hypothetical protein